MRLIFSIITAIVVIAAAIFFFGPLLISTDEVRTQLLAQVENATGYRLRVDGPVEFSLFPSLDLVAEDVGVSQGTAGSEIATAKKLRFGLGWSALWGGKVQLTEVTLVDPVIAVPARTAPAPGAAAGAAGQAPASGHSVAAALQNLTLDKLVIKNGTVILPQEAGAPGRRIEQLNLEASLPSFEGPLAFDMKGAYDGKPAQASGSIGNFGSFLNGTPAPVSLTVAAPPYLSDPASVAGTASYKDDVFMLSQFTAKSGDRSLSGNAVYQGETLTLSQFTAQGYDAVVTGNGTYKGNILTLHPVTAKYRGSTLSGSMAADLSGSVPVMNAAFNADTINVNALMGQPAARGSSAGGGGGGAPGGSGWSDARIDFSPLRAVNGKLKLNAQQLVYDNIKISPIALQAAFAGGKLNAEIPSFKLYNGAGSAQLAVDASGQAPAQRVKLTLSKFDAHPLLKDAAGFENIEGTGAIALDIAANGASQRAMVQTLGGNAKFEFTNGAVRGIDVAKTVQNLAQGTLAGWQGNTGDKTPFTSLGASFKLAGGQAQTSDLQLTGPSVSMTGAGTVNLPARTLQFRVDPKVVASVEGQSGKTDLKGLGVPVIISGPWGSPRIYPDIKGILENPVAAYEQLNKLNQLGGGLVKLPGVEELGEKVGIPGGVPLTNIIKDGTIDRDALQQGAIEGLGQMPNKQTQPKQTAPQAAPAKQAAPRAAPAQKPAAAPSPKKPAAVEPKPQPKPAEAAKTKPAEAPKANPAPAAKAKPAAVEQTKAKQAEPKSNAKSEAAGKAGANSAKKQPAQDKPSAAKAKQKEEGDEQALDDGEAAEPVAEETGN